MRAAIIASAVATAIAFTQPALAEEPRQSAEDIIKFFATAIDLGATRGICIGTEQECAERRAQETAAIPDGMDMVIHFELNSADLTSEARNTLAEYARALHDNRLRAHSFVVEGHTDALGSAEYNLALSQRRAQSVATFLIANGVDNDRLQALGKGMASPRVDNPYDPVNRRVELRIELQ